MCLDFFYLFNFFKIKSIKILKKILTHQLLIFISESSLDKIIYNKKFELQYNR